MSPGPTFERVYLALKEQILSGAYHPGQALEPAALSAGLAASITPVRDALHRLVGERLVLTPRGDGFRTPIYTEASLRDLYGWNLRLLQLAAGSRSAAPVPDVSAALLARTAEDFAADTRRLFSAVAHLSGSAEHEAALASLSERLHPVRCKEAFLFDAGPEIRDMAAALTVGDRPELRRLLGAYHRRRIARVPALLAMLQPVL